MPPIRSVLACVHRGILAQIGRVKQSLPNNPAGINDQIRAAQQQWHTVTFAGGRGNNTFNLGNITDNITNNGLFYPDDASYKISLTHDAYYSPQEILDEGIDFGNVFSSGQEQGSAYVSTVNLNLQAEPNSYSVMIQSADPGVKGNDFFKAVTPWTGLVGYTQKLVKTPFDANKDWVDNWSTKQETVVEIAGELEIIDDDGNEETFLGSIKTTENKTTAKKLIDSDSKLIKLLKFGFGQVFPWIDLASSTISTVKGLIEFFSSQEAEPPRQEVSTTFKEQGLSTGRKAVLINDWNPYAKINLNLPSFSPSDWDAISLAINKPDMVSSGNNTNKGAYLDFTYTDSNNGITSQVDHPLVILENLDKNDSVDKVQKDGGGFAYYTYSFIDPDGANGDLVRDEFNPIRSSSLRLFGQLANPEKLLEEDGSTSTAITFPSDYRYRSENNFDMRYDAENYSSFFNTDSTKGSNHYSRYYLGIQPPTNGLPDNWSMSANLSPLTSNVSLEFDSRTQGWYWQPVLKTVKQLDGSLDAATMLNPTTQDLDYDASKLWINDPQEGWISFGFNEIDENVAAYRYSKLATTFYATSTDKDRDGISDGQEEINKRTSFNRELLILEGYAKFLSDINQRLLSDENKLYSLNQIQSVKTINDFTVNGGVAKEACLIVFNSANSDGEPVKKRLVLYKNGEQLMPAVAVDKDLQGITPSTFEFNYIVDPANPTQRPVFDPSLKDQTVLIRSFAGIYNPDTNTTRLFEFVRFPEDDPDGLTLDEARQAAKTRELPLNFIANTTVPSHLATIESATENDAITGLFTGKAWLAADNYGDSNFQRKTDKWQWLEGESAGSEFWYVQSPFNFNPATQGSIDGHYANWDPNNLPNYSNSRQGLAMDGWSGLWTPEGGQFGQSNDLMGYIAEYEPFTGLPNLV